MTGTGHSVAQHPTRPPNPTGPPSRQVTGYRGYLNSRPHTSHALNSTTPMETGRKTRGHARISKHCRQFQVHARASSSHRRRL